MGERRWLRAVPVEDGGRARGYGPPAQLPGRIVGECFYCEDTAAEFVVLPREDKALRVRCEGCGAVIEVGDR